MADISLKAQGKTNDYKIYKQDTDWLKNSDLVIVECTCPSLGVGYELAFAEVLHILFIFSMTNKNRTNLQCSTEIAISISFLMKRKKKYILN